MYPTPATRFVHLVLAGVAAWWAFVLISPADVFGSSPGYRQFAALAPEGAWGLAFAALAAIGLHGALARDWIASTVSAVMMTVAHTIIAILCFQGNPRGTGAGAYLGYALLSGFVAGRTVHVHLIGRRVARMREMAMAGVGSHV